MHKKAEDENLSCHFNYPKDLCEKNHLQFEEIHSNDGTLHYRVKVNTKWDDTHINNHQRMQLQGWRANCDIQVILDYHSCLEYIAKYASKCEKLSSVAKEAYQGVPLHDLQFQYRQLQTKEVTPIKDLQNYSTGMFMVTGLIE